MKFWNISALNVAALCLSMLCVGGVSAQDYPTKPIKLIVGYAAGGPTDIIARVVAQEISPILGQSVVVENKAGANGNIGTEFVARSPADGYNLIVNTLSHNVNPLMHPESVKYDPVKDFSPVSLAVVLPQLLVVANDSSYNSVADLLRTAKASPNTISFGSAGEGGSAHLLGELLAQKSSAKMTHVPFKGNAPALTEVMAGRVSYMFYPMIGVNGFVSEKKLRILAVTTAKRNPDFPSVPTMAEAGFPGFDEYAGPVGFMAPAGTPPAIVQKLSSAIRTSLAKPAIRERLSSLGGIVVGSTPDEYRQWLKGDAERWAQLTKAIQPGGK